MNENTMELFTERRRNELSISEKFLWSSKVEIFFYKFYNTITLCPIVIVESAAGIKFQYNKTMNILSILMLIYACVHVGTLMAYPFFTNEMEALFSIWSIEINIILLFATTSSILIETRLTHIFLTDFLILKHKIEHDLRILCDPKQFEMEQYSSIKIYTRILLGYAIFSYIVFVLNIYRYGVVTVAFHCLLALPRIFCTFRSFQHQLFTGTLHVYIKLVRIKCEECIQNINQNESMARLQNCRHFTMNSTKMFNELLLSLRIFTTIHRMADLVNKLFGFSLLVLLVQDFLQLLTFIFWVYVKLYRRNLESIIGLWIWMYFMCIYLLNQAIVTYEVKNVFH